MLAANQQMMRQVWPFLADERPVVVDWLPWSHTFGGNHNVNMILVAGGTLYVGHSENFTESRDLFRLRGKTIYERV